MFLLTFLNKTVKNTYVLMNLFNISTCLWLHVVATRVALVERPGGLGPSISKIIVVGGGQGGP